MPAETSAPADANSYDLVEYPGFSYPDTHPSRMAVMAALQGLQAAPVTTCRVLEIGCSEGANLSPMAYALPQATFTGFDLAALPIARGRQRIRDLGLTNLRLFQGDVLEVSAALDDGEYDFIIAHGVYAWVPEPVRDRLLALCATHLAANGIAFISYNALPGSHLRNMVRDVMTWRAKSVDDPADRVPAGLELLDFLLDTRPQNDPYRLLLDDQLKKLRKRIPETLFHDELSPVYHPASISEFAEHAARHGLQYLSEAVLPMPNDPGFRPEVIEALDAIAADDVIAREQMLDFARMRMYRETLLCRADQPLRREFAAEPFRQMRFASSATSAAGEHVETRVYSLPGGLKVGCDQPPAIAVMERLIAAWPRSLSCDEMRHTLAEGGFPSENAAVKLLQQMAVARMIDLHLWEPAVAHEVSARPRATATSRQEARLRPHAANLWHGTVQLDDPVVRALLQLLDGTRDRAALGAALQSEFPSLDPAALESGIEPNLLHFFRAALLEA
jgi:SAM-dependent methyltransferase